MSLLAVLFRFLMIYLLVVLVMKLFKFVRFIWRVRRTLKDAAKNQRPPSKTNSKDSIEAEFRVIN